MTTTAERTRVPGPPPVERPPRRGTGLGLLLFVAGLLWLLTITGVLTLRWSLLLPGALLVIGAALLGSARSGRHGGLLFLGTVLAVVAVVSVTTATTFDVDVLTSGVGDRVERPVAAVDAAGYALGAGTLEVDLRDATRFPDSAVPARVGLGQLVVIVPEDVTVLLDARVDAGRIRAFGEERSGAAASLDERFLPASVEFGRVLRLDASVGLGELEVRR